MDEVYVDSNIFVYAATNADKSPAARELLNDIANGEMQAWTSTLTYDEVCWQLLNHLPEEQARDAVDLFLNAPNLGFIDTTRDIIRQAHACIFSEGADPRDAIHLASMEAKDLDRVYTEDADFQDRSIHVETL
jgi:predicted nucleic acid-binding protein